MSYSSIMVTFCVEEKQLDVPITSYGNSVKNSRQSEQIDQRFPTFLGRFPT